MYVSVVDDEEDITKKMMGYHSKQSELLASCWIDISVYSIVGDDQKRELYWDRITEAYNKNRPKKTPKRTAIKLRSHWNKVRVDCLLLGECYRRCSTTWPSGFNDVDTLKLGHDEFKLHSTDRANKHLGVWDILKGQLKFQMLEGGIHSSKRTKHSDSSAYSSPNPESDTSEYVQARPEGQKVAKRNLKGKGKAKEMGNQSAAGYDELKESFLKTHNEIQEAANAMQRQNDYHVVMKNTTKMSPK